MEQNHSIIFHHTDFQGNRVDTRYIGTMKQLLHELGLMLRLSAITAEQRKNVKNMTIQELVDVLNTALNKSIENGTSISGDNSFTVEDTVPEIPEDNETYVIMQFKGKKSQKCYYGTFVELKEQFKAKIEHANEIALRININAGLNTNPETIEDLIDVLIDCTCTEGRYDEYFELFKNVKLNAQIVQHIKIEK